MVIWFGVKDKPHAEIEWSTYVLRGEMLPKLSEPTTNFHRYKIFHFLGMKFEIYHLRFGSRDLSLTLIS